MALNLPNALGPWKPKITRIHQMWVQPCSIKVWVWMAGYFAASPAILFSFHTPDCLDWAGERIRRGHHRRRKGLLTPADLAKPIAPPNNAIGHAGFAMYNMAQRIGWWLTLIDGVGEWVIQGTSFAYEWSGCPDPNNGYANLTMTNQVPILFPAGTYIINQWLVEEQRIFRCGPTGIATPKDQSVGVGMSISTTPGMFPPLPDCQWSARVVDLMSGFQSPLLTPDVQASGNSTLAWFDALAGGAGERGHNYVVVVNKTEGVFFVNNATFNASGTSLEGVGSEFCGKKPLKD